MVDQSSCKSRDTVLLLTTCPLFDQFDLHSKQGICVVIRHFYAEHFAIGEQAGVIAQIFTGENDRLDARLFRIDQIGALKVRIADMVREIEMEQGHGIRSGIVGSGL
ncbi:hypothetical protein [Sphingomonas sp. PB4P5]|uniref:hypothetical protein n=1 Tax=Parasphingomonas puruogangriensis TaxID=3096155 RepID=UPI003FA73378